MSHQGDNGGEMAEKVSILVVDDRADKLLTYEVMLAQLNQNIVCARSGKEALRRLLEKDFAAIILDVNMPGMDGFETAALMRQRQRCETTPIIFVSAINDTVNHISRGYSLGAVDYILTPIVPDILRAKIAVFVDLFNKTEQVRQQAAERENLVREQAAAEHARAEAERASAAKDKFLAMLSHELRTPLTPVLPSVATLEHEIGLPETMRPGNFKLKSKIQAAESTATLCRESSAPSSRAAGPNWAVSDWDWQLAKRWWRRTKDRSLRQVQAVIAAQNFPPFSQPAFPA